MGNKALFKTEIERVEFNLNCVKKWFYFQKKNRKQLMEMDMPKRFDVTYPFRHYLQNCNSELKYIVAVSMKKMKSPKSKTVHFGNLNLKSQGYITCIPKFFVTIC